MATSSRQRPFGIATRKQWDMEPLDGRLAHLEVGKSMTRKNEYRREAGSGQQKESRSIGHTFVHADGHACPTSLSYHPLAIAAACPPSTRAPSRPGSRGMRSTVSSPALSRASGASRGLAGFHDERAKLLKSVQGFGYSGDCRPLNYNLASAEAFKMADTNNDGVVSMEEAKAFGISEACYKAMDRSGDGYLDQAEFEEGLERMSGKGRRTEQQRGLRSLVRKLPGFPQDTDVDIDNLKVEPSGCLKQGCLPIPVGRKSKT